MSFTTGQRVRLIACERDVPATVLLASSNGCSLMLQFEAIVCGCIGMMPVLQGEDGTYRSVITGDEVAIQPWPEEDK